MVTSAGINALFPDRWIQECLTFPSFNVVSPCISGFSLQDMLVEKLPLRPCTGLSSNPEGVCLSENDFHKLTIH